MRVNTVYLKAGEATNVSEGSCKTFYEGQRLSGLMCRAKVDEVGQRTTAIVTFDVALNRSLHFESRLASGSEQSRQAATEAKPDRFPDGSKLENALKWNGGFNSPKWLQT